MENHKNSFEELKKILTGVVDALAESNEALQKRVEMLETRVVALEQQAGEKREPAEMSGVQTGELEIEGGVAGQPEWPGAGEETDRGADQEEIHVEMEEETVSPELELSPVAVAGGMEEIQREDAIEICPEKEGLAHTGGEKAAEVSVTVAGEAAIAIDEVVMDAIPVLAEEKNPDRDENSDARILNEAAKPDWFDWEMDYPAAYIDDVYKGISFNDRYEFVKELFNVTGDLHAAEISFKETLDAINEMDSFKEVVSYIRAHFSDWDEQSDEVYRFYMIVRRKFNK